MPSVVRTDHGRLITLTGDGALELASPFPSAALAEPQHLTAPATTAQACSVLLPEIWVTFAPSPVTATGDVDVKLALSPLPIT